MKRRQLKQNEQNTKKLRDEYIKGQEAQGKTSTPLYHVHCDEDDEEEEEGPAEAE